MSTVVLSCPSQSTVFSHTFDVNSSWGWTSDVHRHVSWSADDFQDGVTRSFHCRSAVDGLVLLPCATTCRALPYDKHRAWSSYCRCQLMSRCCVWLCRLSYQEFCSRLPNLQDFLIKRLEINTTTVETCKLCVHFVLSLFKLCSAAPRPRESTYSVCLAGNVWRPVFIVMDIFEPFYDGLNEMAASSLSNGAIAII